MEKIAKFVHSRFHNVKNNLEHFLDQDSWHTSQFEVLQNYTEFKANLESLPKNFDEKVFMLFSYLCPLFNSGIFLYKKNSSNSMWSIGSAFKNGKYKSIDEVLKTKQIYIPTMKDSELRKTSPYSILERIDLCAWCDDTDASAFVLQLNSKFAYLLFINLPEPWLRLHLEKIYQMILEALGTNNE